MKPCILIAGVGHRPALFDQGLCIPPAEALTSATLKTSVLASHLPKRVATGNQVKAAAAVKRHAKKVQREQRRSVRLY